MSVEASVLEIQSMSLAELKARIAGRNEEKLSAFNARDVTPGVRIGEKGERRLEG